MSNPIGRATLTLAATLVLATPALAHAELKVTGKPKVEFNAKGPGGLSITGKSDKIALTATEESLTFTVPADTLDTGIALRNNHMKEKYIQVDQFPDLVLVVPREKMPFPAEGEKQRSGRTLATFSTHGVEQELELAYKIKRKKKGFEISGEFNFNVQKHGIEIPTYLGVTVYPDMKAKAKFMVTDE